MASWEGVQEPGVRVIPLSRGKFAKVDEADYEWLNQWFWFYSGPGYAVRCENGVWFHMHRIITNAPDGMDVDHINRDSIDNRRCNLRVCLHSQNLGNSWRTKPGKTSRFKGVHWDKIANKFVAMGCENYKTIYLGASRSEVQAAIIYNEWARRNFGEFARVNAV